jgi:hypothetical protein
MTYEKHGFKFERVTRNGVSTWHVTYSGEHFAYVSTMAVIRALQS